ncbi:MAG TPA: hypothetical protein VK756_06410 [Solirubrobacteraceae bacterium]|jgi:hypothetical protein|nr:hypothetical protein [Solirubrobacteraceae bacterium]
MRSIYRTVLVLAALFALSAATASAALASPEWLVKKGGVYNVLTGATEIEAPGTFVVNDMRENEKLSCELTMMSTQEPGGIGKINGVAVKTCKLSGSGICESLAAVKMTDLPWKTELSKSSGDMRVGLVNGGSGTPQVQFECHTTIGNVLNVCAVNSTAMLENEVSPPNVQARYEGASGETECDGYANAGKVEGGLTFTHPKGTEGLEVVGEEYQWSVGSKAVKAVSKGVVKLADNGTHVSLECEAAGEGTVGPVRLGEETKLTLSKCKFIKAEACEGTPVVEALNLPWKTELSISEGEMLDSISNEHGTTGFSWACQTILGKFTDVCTGALSTSTENVTAGVDATFTNKKLSCKGAPASHEGSVEGTQLIEAPTWGTLSVM